MRLETKVFLTDKDLDSIDNFKDLLVSICREIDCTSKCPLNYKKDVCKCGVYEMTKLIQHLKDNTFVTTE